MTEHQRDVVLLELESERLRQDATWGEQNHPDGTGGPWREYQAVTYRQACESAFRQGAGTWAHILAEELFEALAESNTNRLRDELVQVAAVAVAWVEAIDRRARV